MTDAQFTRGKAIKDSLELYTELQTFLAKFDTDVKLTLTYSSSTSTSQIPMNSTIREALVSATNATCENLRAEFDKI